MPDKIVNEEEVKKLLKVKDFRHLSKEKVIEFVSNIPKMDKEIAIKAIEQFPAFKDYGNLMVCELKKMCDTVAEKNENNAAAVIDAYRKTLEILGEQLNKEDLSQDERGYFADKIVEVADKMAEFDANNKNFLAGLVKVGGAVAAGALMLGAALLGVEVKGKNPFQNK